MVAKAKAIAVTKAMAQSWPRKMAKVMKYQGMTKLHWRTLMMIKPVLQSMKALMT